MRDSGRRTLFRGTSGDLRSIAVIARATSVDLMALLPVGLAGALGILIAADHGASAALGGALVSAFFFGGGLSALFTTSMSDRFGWQRVASTGLLMISTGLLVIALSHLTAVLVIASGLCGAGSALVQPATSTFIAHALPLRRQALAINIKFAAAPGAFLVSGLSLPALAQHLGWRFTYAAAAAVCLVGIGLVVSARSGAGRGLPAGQASDGSPSVLRHLWVPGLSMFLGSMLPGTVVAFMVPALVDAGYSPELAGGLFAALNVMSVLSRVALGLAANHPHLGTYRVVAAMMLLGGAGTLLMLWKQPAALLVGGALAFAMGFGWIGQAFSLAMRSLPDTPGAAAALIQSGGMGGSAVGPLIGAAAATSLGLDAAWIFAASASVTGAVLILTRMPVRNQPLLPRA